MKKKFYKLVLVTQKEKKDLSEYLKFLKLCIDNGCTAIQLREKNLNFSDLLSLALHIKNFISYLNIPLIINDNLKLALDTNADGLHLGQDDGNVYEARKCLGFDKILGLTVNSFEQLAEANRLPVNYIGIGSIFYTDNKKDVENIWGCDGLRKAVLASKHTIVAIGGINLTNIMDVLKTGVHGIAAIGAFHNTNTPDKTVKKIFNLINNRDNNAITN